MRHGQLADLRKYLVQSGWTLLETKGIYEVLRATKPGYPRPLLVYDRKNCGCGYSIDERDAQVYVGWHKNRRKRGLDDYAVQYHRCADQECEPPHGGKPACEFYEYGFCTSKEIEEGDRRSITPPESNDSDGACGKP